MKFNEHIVKPFASEAKAIWKVLPTSDAKGLAAKINGGVVTLVASEAEAMWSDAVQIS